MHVEPSVFESIGLELEPGRLTSLCHASVDIEPVLFVNCNHFAHLSTVSLDQTRMALERGIDLNKPVINCSSSANFISMMQTSIDCIEPNLVLCVARSPLVIEAALDVDGLVAIEDCTAKFQLRDDLTREHPERVGLARTQALRFGARRSSV
jgi:hypothetical protein